jgi:hypothetical protein
MGMGSLRGERSGLTVAMEGDSIGGEEGCQVLYSAKLAAEGHSIHHRVHGDGRGLERVYGWREGTLDVADEEAKESGVGRRRSRQDAGATRERRAERGRPYKSPPAPDISRLPVVYTPGAWHGNNGTCTALGA